MILRGSHVVDAPRAAVFAAILDPGTLLAVIPGCREVERIDDAEYHGRISLRLPAIAGTWRTVVRVVASDPPASAELEGDLSGALGTLRGRASFRLTETGATTTVDYDGTATIDGPLARLDSRFVEGLARSLIGQGLANLEKRLQAGSAGAVAAAGTDRPVAAENPI